MRKLSSFLIIALLEVASVARADRLPDPTPPPIMTVVGALHCDGVEHTWFIEAAPGERTFEWRGDKACEGAEVSVQPADPGAKGMENHSEYDRVNGILRLRVKNLEGKTIRLRARTFGAYA